VFHNIVEFVVGISSRKLTLFVCNILWYCPLSVPWCRISVSEIILKVFPKKTNQLNVVCIFLLLIFLQCWTRQITVVVQISPHARGIRVWFGWDTYLVCPVFCCTIILWLNVTENKHIQKTDTNDIKLGESWA